MAGPAPLPSQSSGRPEGLGDGEGWADAPGCGDGRRPSSARTGVAVALGTATGAAAGGGADLGRWLGLVAGVAEGSAVGVSRDEPTKTPDTTLVTDAAPDGDTAAAARRTEPQTSAVNPAPTAARPMTRPARRLRSSAIAQRAWPARGLGPDHDEEPRSISSRISGSSS
jgi:hypothetical protein